MNRRSFITHSSLASATLATACSSPKADHPQNATTPFADEFVLNEITVSELQKQMQSGERTSEAITQLY